MALPRLKRGHVKLVLLLLTVRVKTIRNSVDLQIVTDLP
jgi:hypothetical protein